MSKQSEKPRGRAATQKDVAERAGVSPSIVSYVINRGPRSVSEATRQRVLKAIEELDYHPNLSARKLIRGKWNPDAVQEFGIVLGGGLNMLMRQFYGAILSGIYHEAYQQGVTVRFTQFLEELHEPLRFNELVHSDEISGLILISVNLSVDYWQTYPETEVLLEKMRERIPNIVCVERGWGKLPLVTFDRTDAARMVMIHLIGLGHQRIAFIGEPGERLESYQRTIKHLDLDASEELIIISPGQNSAEEGYKGAERLLNIRQLPTAIFAACDEVAIGAVNALQKNGIRVPQDMAVVGVDDIDLAQYVHPALTTVRVPQVNMGVQAVRMLMENATTRNSQLTLMLPAELVVRESCGAYLKQG